MRALLMTGVLISGIAIAQTTVTLQRATGFTGIVTCYANYFDTAGVVPMGTCRITAKSGGSGRGGGYVKPPQTWYAASWDLFGNITVGFECAHINQYTSVAPPVQYFNGYTADDCNSTLVDNVEPFILNGYSYYRWIGPSLAGEFVVDGNLLILP